jgi:hypothetical protein
VCSTTKDKTVLKYTYNGKYVVGVKGEPNQQ